MTYLGIILSLVGLAADRALKWYALHSLPPEGVFIVPGLLGLERFKNAGLAFSIPFQQTAILLASLAAAFFIAKNLLGGKGSPKNVSALALIISGAASNFYDRLTLGYVIDYLRLGPVSLVNIADGLIVAGLLLALAGKKNSANPSGAKRGG